MPPKKKLRGAAGVAKAFASGENSLATASNVGSVCPLMLACNACVDSLYSLRHKTDADLATEGLKELPLDGSGKQYVWPVEHGGTFKDIAQRAWKSPDRLLAESLDMLSAAGILDPGATVDVLKTKFCMVEDRLVSPKYGFPIQKFPFTKVWVSNSEIPFHQMGLYFRNTPSPNSMGFHFRNFP